MDSINGPMMQLELLPKSELRQIKRYTFGGVALKKRRKVKRPLIKGRPTDVIMKSKKASEARHYFEGNHRRRKLGYSERVQYLTELNSFFHSSALF